jgi:hypothetical protein
MSIDHERWPGDEYPQQTAVDKWPPFGICIFCELSQHEACEGGEDRCACREDHPDAPKR